MKVCGSFSKHLFFFILGAGSKTLNLSDDSDEEGGALNIGWRRGQPPRSDVVVKFTKNSKQETTPNQPDKLPTAAERVANKILVGPIHKIQKDKIPKPEPKLPPLKFANQHSERLQMEDFQSFYVKRNTLNHETVKEGYRRFHWIFLAASCSLW